jgi:hypothetical protein
LIYNELASCKSPKEIILWLNLKMHHMKKLIIIRTGMLITGLLIWSTMTGQAWKTSIHRITGKPVERTLKIKTEARINIGSLIFEDDSLKKSIYYSGRFLSGSADSVQIKLKEIKMNEIYNNVLVKQTRVPGKYNQFDPSVLLNTKRIALSDIHMLEYQNKVREQISSAEDFFLFGGLIALIISPLFCINYKEMEFNEERYTYCALGSTGCIIAGIALQMSGGQKKFQFRPDWPDKDAKTWSFKTSANK